MWLLQYTVQCYTTKLEHLMFQLGCRASVRRLRTGSWSMVVVGCGSSPGQPSPLSGREAAEDQQSPAGTQLSREWGQDRVISSALAHNLLNYILNVIYFQGG